MIHFLAYKIQDNKIVDSLEVQQVNEFELGYLIGQMAFQDGKLLDDTINETNTSNVELRRGIAKGYYDAEPVGDSLEVACDSYRQNPSKQSFANVVKAFARISDDEQNLDIVDTDDGPVLGVKCSKEDLEAVKELLDNDPELKIVEQDDTSVTLSSDVADSNKKLYTRLLSKVADKHGFVLIKGHLFDMEGNVSNYDLKVNKITTV